MDDLACEMTATICRHLEFYRRHERSVATGLGMRPSDVRCLREFREQTPFAVAELRKRLGLSRSQLSRALSRLEAAELIVRRIDPQNHRCILADITNLGSEIVQALDGRLTQIYRQALQRVPPESGESALRALRQLLACLPPHSPQNGSAWPAQATATTGRRSP